MKFVGKNVRAFHLYLLCYALFLMKYMNYKEWNINHSFDIFFLKSLRGGVDIKWGEISKFILPLKFWTFLHAFQKKFISLSIKNINNNNSSNSNFKALTSSLAFTDISWVFLNSSCLLSSSSSFCCFFSLLFSSMKDERKHFFFMEKTNCFLVPLPLPLSLSLVHVVCTHVIQLFEIFLNIFGELTSSWSIKRGYDDHDRDWPLTHIYFYTLSNRS